MTKLNQQEQRAQAAFVKNLKIKKRKTAKPLVVAMAGIVGSKKTTVAQELAKHLGAAVISGDEIRVCLRKQGAPYESTGKIAENIAQDIIKGGGNVIMDSDFIVPKKRAGIRKKLKNTKARLVFIYTYANYDVMAGRIISTDYLNKKKNLFGGAKSQWSGKNKGITVKLREMWRRTPLHYRWENREGGRWVRKKLNFKPFAEIDTNDMKKMKEQAKQIVQKLLRF